MEGARSVDADDDAVVGVGVDVEVEVDGNVDRGFVTRANSASRESSRCASFTTPAATGTARPDCICFGAPWLAEATGAPCASADCIESTPRSATQIVLGKKDREENGSAFMVQRSRSDGSNRDGI
ncbi:MAG: hypothetical protein ACFNXZ_12320 [Lautropia mirabilis]